MRDAVIAICGIDTGQTCGGACLSYNVVEQHLRKGPIICRLPLLTVDLLGHVAIFAHVVHHPDSVDHLVAEVKVRFHEQDGP